MRRTATAALLLAALATACGERASQRMRSAPPPQHPGLRITMDALHRTGGVPRGWKLTPPPGDPVVGKQVFVDYGCPSCHIVQGETFGGAGGGSKVGPELTGMGSHHPAAYFVEAILNPNAVLIDGPGYVGPDGLSTMPSYDSMSLRDLTDVVAYLQSLTTGDAGPPGHDHAAMLAQQAMANVSAGPPPVPRPPAGTQGAYVVMVYDVLPGKLDAFQQWFRDHGAAEFRAVDGLLDVTTDVDTTREAGWLVTTFRFRDAPALAAFMSGGPESLGGKFDEFIGPHGHFVYAFPPVYRVPDLGTATAAAAR